MANLRADILVAHPYKHHALHLAAGCARLDASTAFALPFYRRGLGAAVARIPGPIGRKASGYFHPGLRKVRLLQSPAWQVRKLWSFLGDPHDIEKPYDAHVAARLLSGEWRARVIVTLQDHMPRTSAAAAQTGAVLWSDQIINLSAAARARIASHALRCGVGTAILANAEDVNTQVLAAADLVTVPSQYTLDGLGGRIRRGAQVHCVPYGVDARRFDVDHVEEGDAFTIVARAHSVRKGGHLLLDALLRFHQRWADAVRPRRLRIVFLGAFEPALLPMYEKVQALPTLSVQAGNIPNADVPALFAGSHLFLMPTLSESMSLACVEAMRAGLPLLITAYAGVDCFVHGEMGMLIEDSAESIDAAVMGAMGDPQQLARWRRNVREASNALTWDAYEQSMAGVAAAALSLAGGRHG